MLGVRDALAGSRGVRVSDDAIEVLLAFADTRIANRRFPDKALDLLESAVANALVAGRKRVDRAAAVRVTELFESRVSVTPTLARFGRDLRALARDERIGPIIGRDAEIDLMIETILRTLQAQPAPARAGRLGQDGHRGGVRHPPRIRRRARIPARPAHLRRAR